MRGVRVLPALLPLLLLLCTLAAAAANTLCVDEGHTYVERSGTIRSQPAAVPVYGLAEDCRWTIAPPGLADGECVVLAFERLSIEASWDFLVLESEHEIKQFSDTFDPAPTYTSYAKEVHLHFTADAFISLGGFIAHFHVEHCGAPPAAPVLLPCPGQGTLTNTTGVIASTPDGQAMLKPDEKCAWLIQPELGPGECVAAYPVHAEFTFKVTVMVSSPAGKSWLTSSWSFMESEMLQVSRTTLYVTAMVGASANENDVGFALEWDIVPCADVYEMVGPDPEAYCEPMPLRTVEGRLEQPAASIWSGFLERGCDMLVSVEPPVLAQPDKCVRVSGAMGADVTAPTIHMSSGKVVSSVRASDRIDEDNQMFSFDFPGALLVRITPYVPKPGEKQTSSYGWHLEWSVHDCDAAVVQQRVDHLETQCNTMREHLRGNERWAEFVDTEGTCCGVHRERVPQVVHEDVNLLPPLMHLRCSDFVVHEVMLRSLDQSASMPLDVFPDVTHVIGQKIHISDSSAFPTSLVSIMLDTVYGARKLDFSGTKVTDVVINNAKQVSEVVLPNTVRALALRHTGVTSHAFVENLHQLTDLVMRYNLVNEPGPIAYPLSLTAFDAQDTKIHNVPTHDGMVMLRCVHCGITDLHRLPSTLQSLIVEGNSIAKPPEVFPPNLIHLSLGNNGIQGDLPSFADTCGITDMDISWNDVTHVDVSPCTTLERLAVHENRRLKHLGKVADSVLNMWLSRTQVPQLESFPPELIQLEAVGLPWTALPKLPGISLMSVDISETPVGVIEWTQAPDMLRYLTASKCKLTQWPFESTWDLFMMKHIILPYNEITELPQWTGISLLVLNLSHNKLKSFPELPHSSTIYELDISHNELVDVGTKLTAFDINVSHNKLETLPKLLTVESLDASHNSLRNVVLDSVDNKGKGTEREITSSLFHLNLSHNNLTYLGGVDGVSYSTVRLSHNQLQDIDFFFTVEEEIDVSHNALVDFHAIAQCIAPSAKRATLSHNQLHAEGGLDHFPDNFQGLSMLNLEGNRISGTVPPTRNMPNLERMLLRESGFSVDMSSEACVSDPTAPECLGEGIQLGEWHLDSRGRTLCPQLLSSSGRFALDTHDYVGMELCECAFGYVGARGECMACPQHAVCRGGLMAPERGYWVHPLPKERLGEAGKAVLQCPPRFADVCAPKSDLAAIVSALEGDSLDELPVCSTGHTDRMCARCDSDYFVWGNKCRVCPHPSGLFFLLAFSAAIVAAVCAYAYLVKPSANASLKILIFFTQTIQLARSTGVPMDDNMASVFDVFGSVMVDMPGIECVWPSYTFHDDVYLAMAMPLMAAVLVMAVFAVGSALRAQGGDMAKWWNRNVGALLLLNFFLYLRVSSSVLAPLRCESDAFLGERFFASAPAERCDATLHGISWMMVVVYVIGVPVGMGAWLFSKRHMLDDETVAARFSFLFASYKKDHWYWEGVITLRKLLILAFLASFRRSSVMVPLMIFLVLVVSVVLQHRVQPFLDATDNHIEFVLLIALSVLFALLVVTNAPMLFMSSWLGMLVMLMQLVCVVGVLYIMVQRQRQRGIGRLATKAVSFLNVNRLTGSVARRPKEKAERSPLLTGDAQA